MIKKLPVLVLTLSLCFFSTTVSSQVATWTSAKTFGGTSQDYAKSVAFDASGNMYVAGTFSYPSITFGTTTLTTTPNSFSYDMYLVKYDPTGTLLWAKKAGGTDDEEAVKLAVDANGNAFITGYFNSTSIVFGTTTITKTGSSNDGFIAKYDASGNPVWAKAIGGANYDQGTDICVDANGNVIAVGFFGSPSLTFGTTTLTNASTPSQDIYVVKYNTDGTVLWAKSGGGSSIDRPLAVTADASGNVYVGGEFEGSSATFGTVTLTHESTSTTTADVFLLKYNSAGTIQWGRSGAGTNEDYMHGVTTDASGNVIIVGTFFASNIKFGTTTLINDFNYDAFVVKYDAAGTLLWARVPPPSINEGLAVITNAAGDVFVGCVFNASVTFGSTTLTTAGEYDAAIAKYSSSGVAQWAVAGGGSDRDYIEDMCIDNNGNVVISGFYEDPSSTFGATTLTSAGARDAYVAKLGTAIVTAVEDQVEVASISTFPNPTKGSFRISGMEEGNWSLTVYNLQGLVVAEREITSSQTEVNVTDLAAGVYSYQLKNARQQSHHGKLIVQ